MYYIIQGIFVLCVECVLTTFVIAVDIGAHEKNFLSFFLINNLFFPFCDVAIMMIVHIKI
jgi:hypothetical protein